MPRLRLPLYPFASLCLTCITYPPATYCNVQSKIGIVRALAEQPGTSLPLYTQGYAVPGTHFEVVYNALQDHCPALSPQQQDGGSGGGGGAETILFCARFYLKSQRFTKTGSGRTSESETLKKALLQQVVEEGWHGVFRTTASCSEVAGSHCILNCTRLTDDLVVGHYNTCVCPSNVLYVWTYSQSAPPPSIASTAIPSY